MPFHRSRDLLILQAGRRLTEVPPPLVAKAEQLGREAGKAAAGWVLDGNTPEEEYKRVLRGIAEVDPAVLGAAEPPAIGPGAGTNRTTSHATSASSPATAPCPGPCPPTPAPSPTPSGRKPSGPPATTPARNQGTARLQETNWGRLASRGFPGGQTASITRPGEKQRPAKDEPRGKRIRQYGDAAGR